MILNTIKSISLKHSVFTHTHLLVKIIQLDMDNQFRSFSDIGHDK